jgi:hypothetical protein
MGYNRHNLKATYAAGDFSCSIAKMRPDGRAFFYMTVTGNYMYSPYTKLQANIHTRE